jgi:hypothetical protein
MLKAFGNHAMLEQAGTTYEVRVELRLEDEPPLLLASRLRTENHFTRADRGIAVLACHVGEGRIVLATAEGHDLILWQIGVLGPVATPSHVTYSLQNWQAGAAAHRITPEMIAVVINAADDGRLRIEVSDNRPDGPSVVTQYQQRSSDLWEFSVIRGSPQAGD